MGAQQSVKKISYEDMQHIIKNIHNCLGLDLRVCISILEDYLSGFVYRIYTGANYSQLHLMNLIY